MSSKTWARRDVLKLAAGVGSAAAVSALTGCASTGHATSEDVSLLPHDVSGHLQSGTAGLTVPVRRGNIRHGVARWTYSDWSLPELCQLVKSLGFAAIDLVGPDDWPILKRYGIDCSMCNGAELNLTDGWCQPQFHDVLTERYLKHIDLVAAAGYRNLICFSGNARGMSKTEALAHAANGLARVIGHAERKGVVLQMELFNSKIDHPDYVADSSAWGIELCQRLGSEHFKLLFDIYHMQIMEGDIIRSIQQHGQYFGHYHTAGVPGRHELDELQELNYPAIAKAIVQRGFTGYLSQEFIPTASTREGKALALNQAISLCDV